MKRGPNWNQNLMFTSTAWLAGMLIFITIIMHLGIIANPGYFSHAEWRRLDHFQSHGFFNLATVYGRVYAENEFGTPISTHPSAV